LVPRSRTAALWDDSGKPIASQIELDFERSGGIDVTPRNA
jgi:hypothetical protein